MTVYTVTVRISHLSKRHLSKTVTDDAEVAEVARAKYERKGWYVEVSEEPELGVSRLVIEKE